MKNITILIGVFYACTSVILGAFGAHYFKSILTPERMESLQTGIKYQMYHALALLIFSQILRFQYPVEKWSVYLMSLGVLFFSGSIYGLIFGKNAGWNVSFLGPITPLGGMLIIGAWLMVGYVFLVHYKN